ncbi:MAG: hypothetical protein ACRDSJ_17020 [Rubrobacteraceae bacterium]
MWFRPLVIVTLALLLFGCGRVEEITIEPLPAGDRGSSELGPGVRPLSYGPGYKSSPVWGPAGERISFTVDGYVVDKLATSAQDTTKWTARDFGARDIEANSGQSMFVLGEEDDQDIPRTSPLYVALPPENTPTVTEIARNVLAAEPVGDGEALVAAIQSGPEESSLALVRSGGMDRIYGDAIEGSAVAFSLSPDRRRAALAVVPPGEDSASELWIFDLTEGSARELLRLEEDLQMFGPPQWTERGIYYVAGAEEGEEDSAAAALYELYRVPEGSNRPEPAPGVGGDFAASSIQVSPGGMKLAILGRLHANSPTDLHILDLETEILKGATGNEDMEIKNGSRDLAWAPDGESVVIIARAAFSNPRVRAASADTLLEEFYNLYEVPVGASE